MGKTKKATTSARKEALRMKRMKSAERKRGIAEEVSFRKNSD